MATVVAQGYEGIGADPLYRFDAWAQERLDITLEAMRDGKWTPDNPNFLCPRCICRMDACKLALFTGWHCPLCGGYLGWNYAPEGLEDEPVDAGL